MKHCIFIALFGLCAAGLFAQRAGDTLYVNVNSASLKSSTGFFASNTGTVRYADAVRVLAVKGKWIQVRTASNSTGWIAAASLSSRRITASANASSGTAREIALAGKGFSQEVEREYRQDGQSGQSLDYSAVDAMEKAEVSERELLSFIDEGRLAKGE